MSYWQLTFHSGVSKKLPSSRSDSTGDSSPLPVLLTAPELGTTVESDVRGNLGPVSVVLQSHTVDWLKDRWQAASDMHGTAIRGMHWIHVKLSQPARITRFLLDWETAYAENYRLEGRYNDKNVVVYFDSLNEDNRDMRTSHSFGQSPGVKQKLPLHIIHNISCPSSSDEPAASTTVDEFHLIIRTPFHPSWGVSLWRVQAFGFPVH
jgi:hypothetical protein